MHDWRRVSQILQTRGLVSAWSPWMVCVDIRLRWSVDIQMSKLGRYAGVDLSGCGGIQ